MTQVWDWIKRNKAITTVIVIALATLAVSLLGVLLNRDLLCSQADLIARVPAAQFPEETREEFIAWIDARRDVLDSTRDLSAVFGGCDDDIVTALEDRVKTDTELAEELRGQRAPP